MSVSIYYEARRVAPLTAAEKKAVQNLADKFSVDQAIEEYMQTGKGLNWESFGFHDEPYEAGVILIGATKLPDNSQDATWTGIQHWCKALGEIRRIIPDAAWHVAVEDHEISWDGAGQAYDPMK